MRNRLKYTLAIIALACVIGVSSCAARIAAPPPEQQLPDAAPPAPSRSINKSSGGEAPAMPPLEPDIEDIK